jgi:hypothetical protein
MTQNGGAPANDDPSFALSIRHGYFSQAFSRPMTVPLAAFLRPGSVRSLQFPRIGPLS